MVALTAGPQHSDDQGFCKSSLISDEERRAAFVLGEGLWVPSCGANISQMNENSASGHNRTTQRITLEIPNDESARAWFSLFNDSAVMQYIGDGQIRPIEWYEGFVLKQQQLFEQTGVCLFAVKAADVTVGFAGLQPWGPSWGPQGRIELGWRLGREFWGLGYATASAYMALEKARGLGINPISLIQEPNVKSVRVAERLDGICLGTHISPENQTVFEYGYPL